MARVLKRASISTALIPAKMRSAFAVSAPSLSGMTFGTTTMVNPPWFMPIVSRRNAVDSLLPPCLPSIYFRGKTIARRTVFPNPSQPKGSVPMKIQYNARDVNGKIIQTLPAYTTSHPGLVVHRSINTSDWALSGIGGMMIFHFPKRAYAIKAADIIGPEYPWEKITPENTQPVGNPMTPNCGLVWKAICKQDYTLFQ